LGESGRPDRVPTRSVPRCGGARDGAAGRGALGVVTGAARARLGQRTGLAMRVTVLGSGSSGNAILVESADTRLLIDAGFSGVDLARRLESVEVPPESIDALFITHDHTDHTRGMGIIARRWGIRLFLTEP